MSRLIGTADRSHQIIEMGAGYHPVAPKSGGWQTHVVDHATQGELRTKYAGAGVDTGSIEVVDTVWRGGALHQSVPASLLGCTDWIIASHVLEHLPDLIGFLQSASHLVRPGGALSIALPDRRYCFDCFRSWTTTGDLLDAHHRDTSRHSLKTAFNHLAYSATVKGQLAWGAQYAGEPVLMDPFAVAADAAHSFRDSPSEPYRDYHAWQFTPAGFQLITLELAALGLSDWQVASLHGPENFEFFAVLRRGFVEQSDPSELQAQRQRLLLAQLVETREQIDSILRKPTSVPECEISTYDDVIAKLKDHDARLQDIMLTLGWVSAMLRPIRRIWRTLHGGSRARRQRLS